MTADKDPFVPQCEFALEVRLRFSPLPKVANMPTGGSRGMVRLESGEFEGPEGPALSGIALPGSWRRFLPVPQ